MTADAAPIGHNNPPEPTPFEEAATLVDGLYEEAAHWLDGEPVTTTEAADKIGQLLRLCREAKPKVEAKRVAEKKPHDDAAKAVQERYLPLLAKLERAQKAAAAALQPFLDEVDRKQRAEAEAARERAEAARKAAEAQAFQASTLGDMERREEAIKAAKKAEAAATKAEKAKPQVTTGGGRALGMKTVHEARVDDFKAFAGWLWRKDAALFESFLQGEADRLARVGPREAAGVTFTERKVPV